MFGDKQGSSKQRSPLCVVVTMYLLICHQHLLPSSASAALVHRRSSNISFHYRVEEGVPAGSFVADLSVDFTRVYHVDDEERHRLRFLLFGEQYAGDGVVGFADRFELDSSTGVLATSTQGAGRRPLDREELCDRGAPDELPLRLVLTAMCTMLESMHRRLQIKLLM